MGEILTMLPGARRALFQRYHVGGCSSCGFHQSETLASLCQRNDNLNVKEVIAYLQESHEQDLKRLIAPQALADLQGKGEAVKLIDIRSREEHEAVALPHSTLLTEELMQELMMSFPRQSWLIFYDHQGANALDAVAYFEGHGFEKARALQGGIDAWSCEVDKNLPRYRLES
ncbi:MAG: rhodanese-like domain-containing protein [Verrucomicrobiae bacterium]|nr:rhodanese-like domain-containing protein [Verrucomicrobiae bacterium]